MTFNELITQLNNMLSNFATTVGNDIIAENRTGTTLFDKGSGYYVSSPTAPVTSAPISLVKTGAVKGGFVAIWYKGAVLTKSSFSVEPILFHDGGMTANELCRIFIDYDLTNDVFSIGIQTGDTGITPGGDTTAPATPIITNVADPTGDTTPPATPIITSIT